MNPLDLHRKVVKDGKEQSSAMSFGINFAVGMGLFVYLGWKLDRRRGGDAIAGTLAGVALGFAYGAYEVWKIVRSQAGGDSSPETKSDDGPPPS